MRTIICTVTMLLLSVAANASEMNSEEQQAWDTLESQLDLSVYGKYEEAEEYFHPELVFWGPDSRVPFTVSESGRRMLELERDNSNGKTLTHTLTPITVKVVGNTAIINALLELLNQASEDAEPERVQVILHNTWVQDGGKWRLLATYNTRLGGE